MEQITKRDGRYCYGERFCVDADDAYSRFRSDYNGSVGRMAFKRLNRLGSRKERIHGNGFVFGVQPVCPIQSSGRIPRVLLGIVSGSYCWLVSSSDMPDTITDDNVDDWIDWAFSKGSGAFITVGKNYKAGRTGKIKRR